MSAEWQPIETAPKDGTEMFGYGPRIGHMIVSYDDSREDGYPWSTLEGYYRSESFTHWMPLPEPPK